MSRLWNGFLSFLRRLGFFLEPPIDPTRKGGGGHPPPFSGSVYFHPTLTPDRAAFTEHGLSVLQDAAAFARESPFGARVGIYAGAADLKAEEARIAETQAVNTARDLVSRGVDPGSIWIIWRDLHHGTFVRVDEPQGDLEIVRLTPELVSHGGGGHPPPKDYVPPPRPTPPPFEEARFFYPTVSAGGIALSEHGHTALAQAAMFACDAPYGARVTIHAGVVGENHLSGPAVSAFAQGLVGRGVNGGSLSLDRSSVQVGAIEVARIAAPF